MDGRFNTRDENGQMIPRRGTKSHHIYLLLKAGLRPTQIAHEVGKSLNHVNQVVYRIKSGNARHD